MRIRMTVKKGVNVVAQIDGFQNVEPDVALIQKVFLVENVLEQLTGYRIHLEVLEGSGVVVPSGM